MVFDAAVLGAEIAPQVSAISGDRMAVTSPVDGSVVSAVMLPGKSPLATQFPFRHTYTLLVGLAKLPQVTGEVVAAGAASGHALALALRATGANDCATNTSDWVVLSVAISTRPKESAGLVAGCS
jgi:hypothetical protein